MKYENDISILLEAIKVAGFLPKNIEKTQFKSIFFYNIYNNPFGNIMSYDVSTGVDSNEKIALLKALVEYLERNAFSESSKKKLFPLHSFSDGFAAIPKSFPNYIQRTRDNSLAEATERYIWASWWDNKTGAQISEIYAKEQSTKIRDLLDFIEHTNIYKIEPFVKNDSGIKTIIIFIKLKNGGYISGGAAGADKDATLFRASSEIIRHYLGFLKYKELNLSPCHFYDERLVYFANGFGNHLVEDRLNSTSDKSLVLPKLIYDTPVPHTFENVVYVHRCLFKNQPLFVGGDLTRLCL